MRASECVCVWRSAKGEAISTRRWLGYHLHPCADTTTDCVYTARAEPLLRAAGSIISQAAVAALFDLRARALMHARTLNCVCAGCAAISRTHAWPISRRRAPALCAPALLCVCPVRAAFVSNVTSKQMVTSVGILQENLQTISNHSATVNIYSSLQSS